jgi:hypothetical protein
MPHEQLITAILEKWYAIKLETLTELQLKQLDAALQAFGKK